MQDRADWVAQRRRLAAREEETDASVPFVDDEGSAVAASRQDVAHDLLTEDRGLPAVVDLDDRVERRDPALRDRGRAAALANPHADRRVDRAGDAADAEDLRGDDVRGDWLRDRGVDQVRPPAREPLEAEARGGERRAERSFQEPTERAETPLLELNVHEVRQPADRVLGAASVRGAGLQDQVARMPVVRIRQDV